MPNYGLYSYGLSEYGGPPVANYVETNQGQFPIRYIEIAPGYGPNDLNPVWVEITSDVTQVSTKRGRQHILGKFDAGTMTVTVDNKTGKYSPFNSSSPYYNQIRPGMPIRFRARWGTVVYPEFYGFVESWPLTWPSANDSVVTVTAVDAMKYLNLKKVLTAAYYQTVVTADAPIGWWRANDSAGASTLVDSSGNGNTATRGQTDPALVPPAGFTWHVQGSPLLTGDTTASLYLGAGGYDSVLFRGNLSTTIDASKSFSFECWVSPSNNDQAYLMEAQTGASAGFSLYYDGTHILWQGPFSPVATGPTLPTNQVSHVVGTCSGGVGVTPVLTLYVNGVMVDQQTSTSGVGWTGSFTLIRIGGTFGVTFDQAIGNGFIQDVAVYNGVLSSAQVLNHYAAGVAPFANDTTGKRMAFLASQAGIPTSMQVIDTGQTTVQGATSDLIRSTVLTNMQNQATTENGALFIDAAGRITFFDRLHASRSPNSSVSLILGDSGAAPEEPYRLTGTVVPYDDADVYNEVTVSAPGLAPQVASDATSQQQHGKRTQPFSLLSAGINDLIGRAQFELNLEKSALPRIDSILVNPADDPTMLWGPVLGFDLLTRVELRRRPMDGSGSMLDLTCLVEGIEHRVTKATWETTWRLSTTDATIIWIIDDPVAGKIVDGALQPSRVVIGY